MKVCILHDIDAYFTISCFGKILSKDFFLFIKNRKLEDFKEFYRKIFHFFELKYCPKSFSLECRVSRYFTEANSRKGIKQVENSKKMVIFTIACYYGNSLQYTRINEKETPGVFPIFTEHFRGLNPNVKQIDHF